MSSRSTQITAARVVPQRARVGRPMLAKENTLGGDPETLRKERIRLAQRSYRNRRDMKFTIVQQRADRLERALETAIKSFTNFQDVALKTAELPPMVALALSRTAIEISSCSQDAHSGKELPRQNVSVTGNRESDAADSLENESGGNCQRIPQKAPLFIPVGVQAASSPPLQSFQNPNTSLPAQPSTTLFPWTNSQRGLTFAQRLRLCCVERGLQLLSQAVATDLRLHPALSLHLFAFPHISISHLRSLSEAALYLSITPGPYGPPPPLTGSTGLEIYRLIEGSELVVGRPVESETQSLAYGRTRTKVETLLPGFEGEWLEPIDVQEYLEAKGISVGSSEVGTEIIVPQTALEVPGAAGLASGESLGTWSLDPSFYSAASIPIIGDIPLTPAAYASTGWNSFTLPRSESAPFQWRNNSLTPASQIYTPKPFDVMSTTLNIQALVETLALNAVCIGPGPGFRINDVDQALRVTIA